MTKFDGERFKTQLKLAKCRLENLLKKHRNTSGGRRREIANLLQQGLEDRARVNVKYLIRDDYLMESYEMLMTCCEDLIQSAGLIAREKTLDADLVAPAKSLLFACGRVDVPELERVKEQFQAKFGREFIEVNTDLGKTTVDPSLVVKLSIRSPEVKLVNRYMVAIAEIFGVVWAPSEDASLADLHGAGAPNLLSTPSSPAECSTSPPPYCPLPTDSRSSNSHSPISDTMPSPQRLQSPTAGTGAAAPHIPDFDELTERFQKLKGDLGKR